ncbi:MAG: [NiFe]-hydrogenase assembly chaperone HybE [Gammaproteobacteria bacterium]|nr:[NiFe]-hydrogenase assembly chaperone HybE [Gammaproteobacteria bacterium]
MNTPQEAAEILGQTFDRILTEKMTGLPIINTALRVQTVGFQDYQGRIIGILIAPWLMNLVMLPGKDDDWNELGLGNKQRQQFPSGTYKFLVNEIDGIGKCQTHALYSPMNEFVTHEHAVAAAQSFLTALMVEKEPDEEEAVDEELLGRILRGEADPGINADKSIMASEDKSTIKAVSRRDLFTGALSSE